MIQINPLKSYIDGGVRAALTTPPSASLVFDLPGKAIWVKGVKLKGTDHTYTFSHDNYITLTNTPDSNESEDIKIGVNTSALKSAIDTTYGVVSTTANGLAPKFISGNKQAATAATTYYFLGWAGTTLKWYQTPFRNIRINSETTDCLGVNNTDPLIISSGNGISVTWDSTNKKIVITNTKPDVNHNTDTKVAQSATTQNKNYAVILKGNDSDEGSITTVNFSTYLKFNPNTKQLTINGTAVSLTGHTHSDYITALGTNGNYLTWTKNGNTNNILVPYANNADKLDGYHASQFISFSDYTNYVGARFINSNLALMAHEKYIEWWQSNAGWFNFIIGNLKTNGSITATGQISADTLKITNTSATAHITFSRNNYNYIVAPAGGSIGFCVNGSTMGSANCEMVIQDGTIFPGTTNVTSLGSASYYWTGVYSQGFYKNGSNNNYALMGGGGHKNISNVQNTAFYKRVATVNGSGWDMAGTNSNAAFKIYAPTTAGTNNQILKSTGRIPTWINQSDLSVGNADTTDGQHLSMWYKHATAYPNGKQNKPWHKIATFSQSTKGKQINTSIAFYISEFFANKTYGIFTVRARAEVNTTSLKWLTVDFMVNAGIPTTDIIATWKNTDNYNIVINIYAYRNGWQSYSFRKIEEQNWGSAEDTWITLNAINGNENCYTSIPSDENQVTSVNISISNNAATATTVDWSGVKNKPNYAAGDAIGGSANYLRWEKASSSSYARKIPISWYDNKETTITRFRAVYSDSLTYRTDTNTISSNISGNASTATTATNLSTKPSIQVGTSDTKKITVTAGGKTSDEYTVPFAIASNKLYAYNIAESTDVNTLKDFRYYVSLATAICSSIINGPEKRSNGEMWFLSIPAGSSSYGQQLYYSRSSTNWQLWTRTWANDSFSPWVQFIHSGNISSQSVNSATYASNVGTVGTVGTNYVTASKVIATCNWYDTMIGSDTDTVINRWSEIVAFVANFKETPDLATYLSNNYLAKSGGTMTGPLKWANETALPQQTSPKYFVCIDAFADGGTTKWTSKTNTLKALTGLTPTAIGDSDEPVYWNGATFVKANAYPTKASWNYDDVYSKKYYYSLPPQKCVKISYSSYTPVIISACRSNGGGQFLLVGLGYGSDGWVRNQFRCLIPSSNFTWKLSANSCTVELYHNTSNSSNAEIKVITTGNIVFTETDALSGSADTKRFACFDELTWANIESKPATATRWPSWNEVTGKPDAYPIATKLQTARMLWGQPFDGTSNVNGHITMNGEYALKAYMPRKKEGSGGWEYKPFMILDVANNDFAHMGVYGDGNILNFIYIGSNQYSSNKNLRIYPDGKVYTGGNMEATKFVSNITTGTSPLTVSSTTLCSNLNADLLDGYHANSFAFIENTYGTAGNFVNGIGNSNYIARGDLGLVGFDNSTITVELYEATSGNSYPSSPTKTITTTDATYGINFRKGAQAIMHTCAKGSKLKIIVKNSNNYIKAVGIYVNLGGKQISFSSTVANITKIGKISTYGSWHIFSCMDQTPTSIILELNTTNVDCEIIIGGFRTYIPNPNNLRFPGVANLAESVSWSNITNKPSSFTPSSHTHNYLPLSGGSLTGALRIDCPTSQNNSYNEGIRCNLGGKNSWASVVLGGANGSTSGSGNGVYSLLVNASLFRIRQNSTDVILINTSNNVGIGTTSPSYKLHVVGDIFTTTGFKKNGSSDSYVLLGGGGHKILSDFLLESEFISKELSANLTTISKSLTVTQAWMDTGITSTDLSENGTYIIQVQVNANDSIGNMYYCYNSGVMSWYKDSTNDTETDEIILHRSGHAYGKTIYLRTVMQSSGILKLQIGASSDIGKAYTYTFKFKRII